MTDELFLMMMTDTIRNAIGRHDEPAIYPAIEAMVETAYKYGVEQGEALARA